MAVEQGFQVDRRVRIAIDALGTRQKATLKSIIADKAEFIVRAARPGVSRKLPGTESPRIMKIDPTLRLIYTWSGDAILVQDVIHRANLEHSVLKKKSLRPAARKSKT